MCYIRGLLLIFCSDQRLSGPKRQDNPGLPLIGWQPTAQGGPRPKTRVSNQMEIILRIRFSFNKKMWICNQGCCLLDKNAVKFCRRKLRFSRNKVPLSSRYNYNSKTAVPMNPTTRCHIPEYRNRDVLSCRQDLKSHIQRAHWIVRTKSHRICVACSLFHESSFRRPAQRVSITTTIYGNPTKLTNAAALAKWLGNKTDDGDSTPGRSNTVACSQTRPDRPWEFRARGVRWGLFHRG